MGNKIRQGLLIYPTCRNTLRLFYSDGQYIWRQNSCLILQCIFTLLQRSISISPCASWRLWDVLLHLLLSSSNRKYESLSIVRLRSWNKSVCYYIIYLAVFLLMTSEHCAACNEFHSLAVYHKRIEITFRYDSPHDHLIITNIYTGQENAFDVLCANICCDKAEIIWMIAKPNLRCYWTTCDRPIDTAAVPTCVHTHICRSIVRAISSYELKVSVINVSIVVCVKIHQTRLPNYTFINQIAVCLLK